MSQGRPIPPEHFAKFLELLREVPNVTRAARTTGHAPSAFRRHKALDKEFSQAWDEALDESVERMEEEVHRRAFVGVDEPVFFRGNECGTVIKHSDQLAMFLLKAHRPEKYRERSEVNLSNPDGSLTLTDAEKAAKIAAMIALAKSRQSDNDGSDLC